MKLSNIHITLLFLTVSIGAIKIKIMVPPMVNENFFEKKYGIREIISVKNFHKTRRMFCIYNNVLYIAEPNLSYSHAQWFINQGWISPDNDSLMNKIPRGMVSADGDVYFFVGYDFAVTNIIENIFFDHFQELAQRLALKPEALVYGGLIKQTTAGQWPPQKNYGTVSELLQKVKLRSLKSRGFAT